MPNPAARSLVTQRTDSFALVLPETASRVFSDDLFFPGLIQGRQRRSWSAADKQLVLTLADVAGQPRPHRALRRWPATSTA